ATIPAHCNPTVGELDGRNLRARPKLDTGGLGLLDEKVVEALPLRHQHDGAAAAPLERGAEADAEAHRVDTRLDDRLDREGQELDGAHGEATAARLVTRKFGAIEQQHRAASSGEAVGRRRATGTRADDDDV